MRRGIVYLLAVQHVRRPDERLIPVTTNPKMALAGWYEDCVQE